MLKPFEKFMLLVAAYVGTLRMSDWTILQEARALKDRFPWYSEDSLRDEPIDVEQRAWEFFEYQLKSYDSPVQVPKPEWMR